MNCANLPLTGTRWLHNSGRIYRVVGYTNLQSTSERYPPTIRYADQANVEWSRPLTEWPRSMRLVDESLIQTLRDEKSDLDPCPTCGAKQVRDEFVKSRVVLADGAYLVTKAALVCLGCGGEIASALHSAASINARLLEIPGSADDEGEAEFDNQFIAAFADSAREKMRQSRLKGRNGWHDRSLCSSEMLQEMLEGHILKGDPLDVSLLGAMMWFRGDSLDPNKSRVSEILAQ